MSAAKKNKNTVELTISGHQVSLTFAPEQNPIIAQQIRASLIDSFIRQHGNGEEHSTLNSSLGCQRRQRAYTQFSSPGQFIVDCPGSDITATP